MTIQKLSDVKLEKIDNSQYYDQVVSLDLDAVFKVNDIKVFYSPSLDGGGTRFGRRYPHVIKEIYGDKLFKNCFEWCSGPGFIGFELLSEDICDNLFLADIYQPALAAVDKTVANLSKKYEDRVHSAHIKGIADLPVDWKFDLVVANPPHLNHNLGAFITNVKLRDRLGQDLDWNIHREFFNHIGPHLNENAVILLQEHSFASGPIMFKSMIEEAGLKIKECYYEKDFRDYYYLEVEKN
jgi:methylase of polypeptide subunit release factors